MEFFFSAQEVEEEIFHNISLHNTKKKTPFFFFFPNLLATFVIMRLVELHSPHIQSKMANN
jgi:hypothetical protein